MDTFNMGQLTKEMVSGRLKEMEDPCAAAAEVMEKAMLSALRNAKEFGPAERSMVAEMCYGAITAILLRHQCLSRGGIEILRAAGAAAGALHIDPTEMMTQAIRGLARIRSVCSKDQLQDLSYGLDREFMGAGERLREECQENATLPLTKHFPYKA